VIAIGASAGGPKVLRAIFSDLPEDFPIPIVVVQHMVEGFIEEFAQTLDEVIRLKVRLAQDGDLLESGTIYVAPDGAHTTLHWDQIVLEDTGPHCGHCPSIDRLFESVAETYGFRGVGVLLTGMGRDGAQGLKKIQEAGGFTIAQDETTSAVFGMPRAAIELGATCEVLPASAIATRLISLSTQ